MSALSGLVFKSKFKDRNINSMSIKGNRVEVVVRKGVCGGCDPLFIFNRTFNFFDNPSLCTNLCSIVCGFVLTASKTITP